MFDGLSQRFTEEVRNLAPEIMKEEVKVISCPERKFSSWIGGSILSSSPQFVSMYVTKAEYEDYGATIIHRKFF